VFFFFFLKSNQSNIKQNKMFKHFALLFENQGIHKPLKGVSV